MNQILSLINIDNCTWVNNDRYVYNGMNVPRVTEILSSMLHDDYLMTWSNSIGLYNHQKYEDVLNKAADIGSYTHKAIELYLSNMDNLKINELPGDLIRPVDLAFNSFLEWWDIVKSNKYIILMQEEKLVCKYFGGTLDLYLVINGKKYIVDFKTSNHINCKYFLQLAAYRYLLMTERDEDPDGCVILMLDKKRCKFTEFVLDFSKPEHLSYIDHCQETFLSLVYAYYNRKISENKFNDIFGRKKNGV